MKSAIVAGTWTAFAFGAGVYLGVQLEHRDPPTCERETAVAYELGYETGARAAEQQCELCGDFAGDLAVGISALEIVADHIGRCVLESDLAVTRRPAKVGG